MAKLILHPIGTTLEEIARQRLLRSLERSPNERMHLAFRLMELSLAFKNGPIKLPQGKGIILKKKGV